jgi:hypothetical protein
MSRQRRQLAMYPIAFVTSATLMGLASASGWSGSATYALLVAVGLLVGLLVTAWIDSAPRAPEDAERDQGVR